MTKENKNSPIDDFNVLNQKSLFLRFFLSFERKEENIWNPWLFIQLLECILSSFFLHQNTKKVNFTKSYNSVEINEKILVKKCPSDKVELIDNLVPRHLTTCFYDNCFYSSSKIIFPSIQNSKSSTLKDNAFIIEVIKITRLEIRMANVNHKGRGSFYRALEWHRSNKALLNDAATWNFWNSYTWILQILERIPISWKIKRMIYFAWENIKPLRFRCYF